MHPMNNYFCFLALLVLGWSGCTEIFSPDISNTVVALNSPVDSLYTSEQDISFWWEQDSEIEAFQLQVTKGGNGNLTLLADTNLITNSVTYTFDSEGTYLWKVRGINAGSESAWSSASFIIDQTAPEKAFAQSYFDDTLGVNALDSLAWSSLDFPLEGIRYPTTDSLVIFRRDDSTTVGARYFLEADAPRVFPFSASSPLPFNGSGVYHWQVVSFDKAGNRKASDLFKITIP